MHGGTSPGATWASLLLAAGRGSRLRPLTDRLAKPALPILDVPLGAWGLAALERSHPPVVVNAGHLFPTVGSALSLDGRTPSRDVSPPRLFVEQPEPFGTGGTLRALRDDAAERVVTWNSDSLTDVDLDRLLMEHETTGALATIAIVESSEGDFEHGDERVTRLIDRRTETRPGARFVGVAVYERDALGLLPDVRPLGATEGLLQPLLERGELAIYEHHGYWLDVGTPARYVTANLDVLEGRAPPPPRGSPGELIDVPGGRAYAGPGVGAEMTSLGPGAILLAGSVVESGARVTGSVVWPGERIPAGTELEGSIWFGGRALPAGEEL